MKLTQKELERVNYLNILEYGWINIILSIHTEKDKKRNDKTCKVLFC